MKNSKAFRLSEEAVKALAYLSEQTGTNETAIVEMALAFYRQAFDNAKVSDLAQFMPVEKAKVLARHLTINLPNANKLTSGKKRRRRS
jgi:hypothetical protein